MIKTDILDEVAEIRRVIYCFSHLFSLISGQSEPLDAEALGAISRFFEDVEYKIKEIEKGISTLESDMGKIPSS
ncbi:MAG: hypothetical protein MJE63_13805 [Proteobacteria bacterium]|nr:hypothetical protein [Pseudomonadota bacterium]